MCVYCIFKRAFSNWNFSPFAIGIEFAGPCTSNTWGRARRIARALRELAMHTTDFNMGLALQG